MRLGITQLILLLIIAGLILLTIRGAPAKNTPTSTLKSRTRSRQAEIEYQESNVKAHRRKRMRWLGGFLVVAGIVSLGGTLRIFTNVVTAVFSSGTILILLAIITVLIGVVALVYSLRR